MEKQVTIKHAAAVISEYEASSCEFTNKDDPQYADTEIRTINGIRKPLLRVEVLVFSE